MKNIPVRNIFMRKSTGKTPKEFRNGIRSHYYSYVEVCDCMLKHCKKNKHCIISLMPDFNVHDTEHNYEDRRS